MARLGAGSLALALGLAAWSAAAETAFPVAKPTLAAAPLPALKPSLAAAPADPALIVRIDFPPAATELSPAGRRSLAELAGRLKGEPDAPVAIRAYAVAAAEGMSARRVSLGRALAVRSFLVSEGVSSARLSVQAFDASAGDGPAERVDISWPPR
jgi:outer membrane protein OmpA-like peptidoglycan-associated protein